MFERLVSESAARAEYSVAYPGADDWKNDHARYADLVAATRQNPDIHHLSPPAATREADLIVAGAYGRPALREGRFGGATKDLSQNPSLPILMSH